MSSGREANAYLFYYLENVHAKYLSSNASVISVPYSPYPWRIPCRDLVPEFHVLVRPLSASSCSHLGCRLCTTDVHWGPLSSSCGRWKHNPPPGISGNDYAILNNCLVLVRLILVKLPGITCKIDFCETVILVQCTCQVFVNISDWYKTVPIVKTAIKCFFNFYLARKL